MKVALLSFDFGEYCVRLASALAREAEVSLLLPDRQVASYLPKLERSVRLHPFGKPRLRQPLQQIGMIRANLARIRQFDPDVLHIQQGHLWFNLALPLLSRYPLVLTVHDPLHHLGDEGAQRTPQAVMHYGFRRARRIVVHSQRLRRVVVDRCRIAERIVDVIPHIALGDEPVEAQPREEGRLVLFFGRIWAYKGLEYLIRAAPRITAELPDARIVIAGEGEDFARYRRMIVNPDHFIVRNEYVPDEARTELFRRASVVVLPYVEASQSGVIPLAYRFGKPVVATTVGGLPEMVDHGRTGLLVPPRDERALAEAVVRILSDDGLRRRLGAAGQRKLESECAPAAVASQTLEVYRRALNRDESAP
ncbi:MAG TPA: glycosyltransferase family 4 protein [Chloroflexota bacterium]